MRNLVREREAFDACFRDLQDRLGMQLKGTIVKPTFDIWLGLPSRQHFGYDAVSDKTLKDMLNYAHGQVEAQGINQMRELAKVRSGYNAIVAEMKERGEK